MFITFAIRSINFSKATFDIIFFNLNTFVKIPIYGEFRDDSFCFGYMIPYMCSMFNHTNLDS